MHSSTIAVASFAVGALLLGSSVAQAQTGTSLTYESSLSRFGTAGGYSYSPPSYAIGWQSTPIGLGYGYGYGVGSPAYLHTTRPPQLNYIPLQYQSAYRVDRVPAFGYGGLRTPPLATRSLTLYSNSLAYPGSAVIVPGPYVESYATTVYRPYVTTSQYVYVPTYHSATYISATAGAGAICGAYGYSAIYGY